MVSTLPPPASTSKAPPLDPKEILLGLTENADETPGLSIVSDAYHELEALAVVLSTSDVAADPVGRVPMVVLLQGLTRRLSTGVEMLRREIAPGPSPTEP